MHHVDVRSASVRLSVVSSILAAIGLAGLAPATAAATVISFDDQPSGVSVSGPVLTGVTPLTNQYPEATFSSSPGNANYVSPCVCANSSPNILVSGPTNGNLNATEDTYITFTAPVNNLTFWAIEANYPGTAARFNIYTDGAFAGTRYLTGLGGSGNQLVDLSTFSHVTRLEIVEIVRDARQENGIGWDTFSFQPIPEPDSASLVALGLLALVGRRSRRTA